MAMSPEERRRKACERAKKWRLLNKDRERETKRQRRLLHREENRKWYLRNRDEIRKRRKESDTPARREAATQRAEEYYRAHKHLRQTQEGRERACKNAKEYYQRHRDKIREREKANTQKRRAQLREWRRQNPEKYKAQLERNRKSPELSRKHAKAWYDRHPERAAQIQRTRRAAMLKAGGSFTVDDIARLYALQEGKCAGCGSPFKTTGAHRYHVDHIIPLRPADGSEPGSNGPENLQLLCRRCNCQKRNLSPEEWKRRRKA